MPQNTQGGTESGGQSVGSETGVPPSAERKMFQQHVMEMYDNRGRYPLKIVQGEQYQGDSFTKMYLDMVTGKATPRPATGLVPAEAPKPMQPHSEAAVPPVDPSENVATEDDEGEIAYYPHPKTKGATEDAALADPKKPGGPSDYSDPSPVNAEHVMNLMRSNFPEDAIGWVMRARWVGPVNLPWNRIDSDDIDSWAASHQQGAVNRFAKDIKAGTGHTNPSILIQDNDSPKAIIVDGHHRALAHKKLGQDILAYLGVIDPKDRQAAEETHSKQVHSGSNPENRLCIQR